MKNQYTLLSNLKFLLGKMKIFSKLSFYLLFLRIPLKVLLPFIGIYLPNIVVRSITDNGSLPQLIVVILILGGIMVAGSFCEQYAAGIMDAEAAELSQGLDNELFYKRLECDYESLENKEIAGRLEEAGQYIWQQRRYIARAGENLVMLGSGVFGFFVYLSVLRTLPPALLLLMIIGTCISFFFSDLGEKQRMKRKNYWGDGVRRMSYLHRASADSRAGKDIRMYQMMPWFENKFIQAEKQIRNEYINADKKNFLSAVITAAAGIVMEIFAYCTLTGMVLDGRITAADYVLYIGAVLGFSGWIKQIAEQMQKFWMMKGDVSCIRECMNIPVPSEKRKEAVKQSPEKGCGRTCEIDFIHVTYRYAGSGKDIIHDLSFHIKKGERVALVGMNGAGKTTCVKLLCGLLKPTSGEIRINGIPSDEIDNETYLSLFSTVFQEINLFPATVRENITGCKKGEEDERKLKKSMELADLSGLINSLPHNLDTMLVKELDGEAVNLSGGQMQRLLLARALYKDACILVLDEPTAALDPISENNVYRKYNELTSDNTSIFISHRLASTRFCDRILYLEDGQITETGTHQELLMKNGRYARTFEIQSRYYRQQFQEDREEISFA